MTLIMTAFTPDFIVQVSDRRLTWPDGRTKDGFVKAIVTPHFACSYTGVASLGGDTAGWLAKRLAAEALRRPYDAMSWLNSLAGQLTEAFRMSRYRRRPLAIVVVGWYVDGPLTAPRITVVANYPAWVPTYDTVDLEFTVTQIVHCGASLSSLMGAGQLVHVDEANPIRRAVEQLCVSGRATVRAIAQLLTELVRTVSRASSRPYDPRAPTVSEDVLVIALPRPAICSGQLVVGQLLDDWWSVTCIPAGESRRERPGGPIVVGAGAAIRALEPHEGPRVEGGAYAWRKVMTHHAPEVGELLSDFSGLEILQTSSRPEGSIDVYLLTDPPIGTAWGWPGVAPQDAERVLRAGSGSDGADAPGE